VEKWTKKFLLERKCGKKISMQILRCTAPITSDQLRI
jgi:hypothetical protein